MLQRDRLAITGILGDTPEFKPAEVTVAEEVIDSYLADPDGSGYYATVAEMDSAVVGYISYGPTPLTEGTWDVYWMAVTPKKKGQGIGDALLAYAEDSIKEAKGRLVLIETSSLASYEPTRRFYQGRGYELISRIPDFYAPGDDKVTLQKRLR